MSDHWLSPIFNFKEQNLEPLEDSHWLVLSCKKLISKTDQISASCFIQISHVKSGKVVRSLGQDFSLADINSFLLCFAMLDMEKYFKI